MSWRHEVRRRAILMGEGSLDSIGLELDELGVERALAISSPRSSISAAADLVRRLAGERLAGGFAEVGPRTPLEDVVRAFERAKEINADGLIVVGGGSASDAAKVVALLLNGVAPEALSALHSLNSGRLTPIVAVPTTLSGAEITWGGMFFSGGSKLPFGADGLGARLIFHDPRQLADVPAEVLTSTGMNGLAHCLEALTCLGANPITDAIALEGASKLASGMVHLGRGDHSTAVLTQLQVGAAMGGTSTDTASIGIHHALCHALGAVCGIAHGSANSVVLPYALAYNQDAAASSQRRATERLGPLLLELGVSDAKDLSSLVMDLQSAVGVPRSLSQLGVNRSDLTEVARQAYVELTTYRQNPRLPESPDELVRVLEQAFG